MRVVVAEEEEEEEIVEEEEADVVEEVEEGTRLLSLDKRSIEEPATVSAANRGAEKK